MAHFIIYGCTGYTGRLVVSYARSFNLDFVIAGRTEDKTKALAAKLDLQYRVFDTNDPKLIDESLKDVRLLLNCAGPFIHTARPLMESCIRTRTHYLDVSAELISYHLADELDGKARDAKVMLMPGCGGSVAMLGCLAGHGTERISRPRSINIALHVAGSMSRGSSISAAEGMTECIKRVNGTLSTEDVGHTCDFDFGDGKGSVSCFPVTLPDLITIWKSTGAPNIRTFVHSAGNALPTTKDLSDLPDGPTAQEREANPYRASVAVTGEDGVISRAVLHTVNGYTFTSQALVEAAKRVLGGEVAGGFRTPVGMFGNGFVDCVAASAIRDLE